jgi:alpha-2-macroglobulin
VLEIQLVVNSRSAMEYLHLKAPRPAGFEPERLTSGWHWDKVVRFEEVRDSLDNFFLSWLPQGELVVSYRLRATTPGRYRFGATLLQSLYAPEFSAYAGTFGVRVAQ